MRSTVAVAAAVVLLADSGAAMEQRFPPPDFGPDYSYPDVQQPQPQKRFRAFVDVAALVAALSLASYLALVRRSRRGMQLLTVFSLAYFGFWREGCVCPIGAIQNVTLGLMDPGYVVPAIVTVFFVLPLVFTLFFGRTFCAGVCPLGAIQDLVLLRPGKRPLKVPDWLEHGLGMLRHVYLVLALLLAGTGAMFVICQYDPFVSIFRLSGTVNMLVLGASFLVVGVFVGRPYCRYVCPYGALLGWLSKVSRWRVSIYPEECVQCRLCEDSCPFGAIRRPTEDLGAAERTEGRTRLAVTVAALPALVAAAAAAGYLLGGPLSRTHATVRLSDRVRLEEAAGPVKRTVGVRGLEGRAGMQKRTVGVRGLVEAAGEVARRSGSFERIVPFLEGTTDASDAFRKTERPVRVLHAETALIVGRFARGGLVLGGFLGLLFWAKLAGLSVRRRRTDYEADRARCVSCGRCFGYCPNERARRLQADGPQSDADKDGS